MCVRLRHDLIYPINISVLVFSEFKYILQQKIKDSSKYQLLSFVGGNYESINYLTKKSMCP